jgi:LDH2 family malate/lactate/ureidoglycolate dehydrogenase
MRMKQRMPRVPLGMMVSLLGTLLGGCNNDAAEQQVRVGSGISLSPLGGIDLRITADLTGNSYTRPAVVKIYDDINSNGVAEDNEQVLAPGMPAFDTRTGPYDGEAWNRS